MKLIKLWYGLELSFTDIAKKLERRSAVWVQHQYKNLFRKELRVIKDHLYFEKTNDEICTEIKNGAMTIETFEDASLQEKAILLQSIELISQDRHGQKLISQ